MPTISKPTNGSNANYADRIGQLFDAFNNGNYNFPATQVASADANTLDDYEEGTYTAGVAFGGGTTGITYSAQGGHYTKIGRQVTCIANPTLSNKGSSTGTATLTGLPFTIKNSAGAASAGSVLVSGVTYSGQFHGFGVLNTTTITTGQTSEAGTYAALTDANFTNASDVIYTFTYFV